LTYLCHSCPLQECSSTASRPLWWHGRVCIGTIWAQISI
jgi:hypothetical protein